MRNTAVKRVLAFALTAGMVLTSVPARTAAAEPAAQAKVTVPEPYYEFTFDKGVADNQVDNEGSKTGVKATIEGDKEGLGVVEDVQRGNKVLNLPGGDTNGKKEGRLSLPRDMFADVTEAGFAFSFWINIDESAGQYSRIFSGTVNGQNSSDGNGGRWDAPEFSFVAGSETAGDMTEFNDKGEPNSGYNSAVLLPDQSAQLKLVWGKQFAKGKWQHVTISVSPTAYDIYLDGQAAGIKYDRNSNKSAVLTSLFANNAAVLKQYKDCAIGASVYTTDKDLKAKVDEFRFYNTALTADQAKAAYDSYAVSDSVIGALEEKITEAEAKSASFYTKETYEKLQKAVQEGKAGVENPVTEANVTRLTANLQTAISGLKYYEGVTAQTTFSNAQLKSEVSRANVILAQGGLSGGSETAIKSAVQAADAALKGTDQAAVDAALLALRTAIGDLSYGATLHFNADPAKSMTEVFHGSTGFLYGVSEIGVPSADMIQAIQPKILVQKAADGKQHPSGDGYRLTHYLKECGVENIQIYLQDYYLEWPYENTGMDDYNNKVDAIVRKMVEGKTEEEIASYSFVLFNEPDGIWYGGVHNNQQTQQRFFSDWQRIYNTVKDINPNIKVAGPNFASYGSDVYRKFFAFCQENRCLPEYITWHELQKPSLTGFQGRCKEVKGFVETYYANSGIEPIIFVNETINFDDLANPGALVNWLAIFDEEDVYASLPYWGLAHSMNELAADANKPDGAWWVYKWYAQMTGKKMPLTLENIEAPGAYGRLYGFTSMDDEAGMAYCLFGGQAGKQTVSIENITSTRTFAGADKAHVKLYSTKYTGHHGFADSIPVEFEGNIAFTGNDLIFSVQDAQLMDAYYAVITPAAGEKTGIVQDYQKNWEQTYEAEDAVLIGKAFKAEKAGGGDLARSNRKEVGGIDTENDGLEFTVNVPESGRYRMDIYYSSQAPQVNAQTLEYVGSGGQNRAIGALVRHTLTVDNGQPQEVIYDSTVKWGYYNYRTVYVELTKGSHKVKLMHKGDDQTVKEANSRLCASLDKIDLSWAPKEPAVIKVEPEELTGSQAGFALAQQGTYSGAGTATGSGIFDFYVCVPEDGYYKLTAAGSGTGKLLKKRVNYAKDAKAESAINTDWMELFDVKMGSQDAGKVYLTAGINHLAIQGNGLVLDLLTFTEDAALTIANSITVEAEDCEITESASLKADTAYTYLPASRAVPEVIDNAYASGGKAVEGFRGGSDNTLTLKVNAAEAGDYKLSVFYSNDEPAPVMKTQSGANYVHPYNTDLVERYMQISVNGGAAQTVYFKNTFCWDTFKNTIVDVKLNKGENTISFTNDNSYKFSSVQDDFTPRLDKFVIAPAKAAGTAEEPPVKPPVKKNNKITGVSASIRKVFGDKGFVLKAKGKGKITYTSGNKKIVKIDKTSGKASIIGCGKAVITVKAAGNAEYKPGTKKVTVTIAPKPQKISSVKSPKKKTLTVKWKKDAKADGYQIQYSTNSKFKGAKTVDIKKNKTVKTTIKKGLKGGKKYYVRVRSYKKDGKKAKICGSYSKAKSVKVKK